jgi:hypothetical protein
MSDEDDQAIVEQYRAQLRDLAERTTNGGGEAGDR